MKSLMLAAVLLASTSVMAQNTMPNANDRTMYDPYGVRTQEQERLRNPDSTTTDQRMQDSRTSKFSPDDPKNAGTTPAGGNPGTLGQPHRE